MDMEANVDLTIADVSLLKRHNVKCDRYDYLAACTCGVLGGVIDIFLVGSPKDSMLGKWTDAQIDNAVRKFAKVCGWKPHEGNEKNIASAIGFLEKKFKVNYDQRHSKDVGNLFNMSTKNHHIKSLGHAPDVIGLFFSILNQFTSTSSFISNGQWISVASDYTLQGENFIAKLFCGIANWFGHIMSDIAGSSGGRGQNNGGRGSGVVIPFYEFFQFCTFGKFSVGKDKQDLAMIATRAFQEGYDFRFGMALAIPVLLTELSIRLIWALRRYFQYQLDWKDCIPTLKHDDLRLMLLCGHGTLCVIDGLDAGIRSGGNFLFFFMRLNLLAWFRLVMLVVKDICMRWGIDGQIEAYKQINEALQFYLKQLKQLDKGRFEKETQKYHQLIENLSQVATEEGLTKQLLLIYNDQSWELPWQGDFDEHMSNPNGTLVFK